MFWVVSVLRYGYRLPFLSPPPLSPVPLEESGYAPSSLWGALVREELHFLLAERAWEPASSSPGFYSCLSAVQQGSGKWQPLIDLSSFDTALDNPQFAMGP